MNSFGLWIYIALSWVFVDWIIAGDILLSWAGGHQNSGVIGYLLRLIPAAVCWIVWQKPDAWRKPTTYRGLFICALAATPAIPLLRMLEMIAANPAVIGTVPAIVAFMFIAVMAILIASKVAICVYWWRRLQRYIDSPE
jgi:hypothetical protein